MEFHVGICITEVLDFQIEADSKEEAGEIFKQMSRGGKLGTLPQAQLDRNIEVLGMIEGPLPVPPSGSIAEHEVMGGEVIH